MTTRTGAGPLRVVILADPAHDMPHSFRTFLRGFRGELDAAAIPYRVISPAWPVPSQRSGGVRLAVTAFYRQMLYPLVARRYVEPGALTFVLSTGLAQLLRFAPRSRIVMFCHDVFAYLPPDVLGHDLDFGGAWRRRVLTAVQRPLIAGSAAVLAPSEATKRDLVGATGIDAARVTVMPHRVDRAVFCPGDRQEARRTLGLDTRDDIVMAVVTAERRKNAGTLLDAFARLARDRERLRLLLLGPLAASEERTLATPAFRGRVRRLRDVETSDVARAYRAADCLAHVSLYEGFGYPVLEAMASGCPVVTSNRGALAEVADGCAEMTDPASPEAIARSIARVLDDEAYAARLRADGLRRANAHSGPRGYAAWLEEVWRS